MAVIPTIAVLVLLLHTSSRPVYSQSDNSCSRQDYYLCVKMADPLLKDARLIFPDNKNDIDVVCSQWSKFVDCVKRYTDRCFTESRRQEFNKAVESPVDSVHQMCTVTKYQTEYLTHASCIKSMLTSDEYCGGHYQHLVEQVSGEADRVSLCCSHLRFRECVLEKTKLKCDSGMSGGSATRFSRQMLDKALSFLRDQCYNYVPTMGECPILSNDDSTNNNNNYVPDQQHRPSNQQPYSPANTGHTWQSQAPGTDRRVTSSPETEGSAPWMPNSGSTGHRTSSTRDNWTPSGSDGGIGNTPPYDEPKTSWMPGHSSDPGKGRSSEVPSDTTSSMHPTSTYATVGRVPIRPSSYGRGITWTPSTNMQTSSADGGNTWHVTSSGAGSGPKYKNPPTTEPWYPAVGNNGGNAVDEPNQQGLANNNGTSRLTIISDMVIFMTLLLYTIMT